MYSELWETKLQIIRVQDQIKYCGKDIRVGIFAVTICRSESWWEWLDVSTLILWICPKNFREKASDSRKAWISGNSPRSSKPQYINNNLDLTLIKRKHGQFRERRYISRG